MRASRRALLATGAALSGLGATAALGGFRFGRQRGPAHPAAITVGAKPITSFTKVASDRRLFGALTFRGGLVLSSDGSGFGGFSGLWRGPDGVDLVAISDNAIWLTAKVASRDGRASGLADAVLAPVLGEAGEPLAGGPAYDTEALAIVDGTAYVGIERVHQVRRFAWARDGVLARGVRIPVPPETKTLEPNSSLEAVAVVPRGARLAGAVIAIAEEVGRGATDPTRGWVLTGEDRFGFDVARSDDFDITDAAFLPSGELLLLERRFSLFRGVACRMRRVPAGAIRPKATIDGPVILQAGSDCEIDNMEGLALHRDPATGATIATLISDDNFSPLQRTVLLEFALDG